MSKYTHRISRVSSRKIVSVGLITILIALLIPKPVGAAMLHSIAGNLWERKAGNDERNRERKGVRSAPPQSKAEREAKVASIQLNVGDEIQLSSRQPMLLIAIPVDQDGQTIHGLKVKWQSSNKRVFFVRKNGEVLAGLPGEATLTAKVGSKEKTVKVKVVEGTKEPFGGKKRVDSTRKEQLQAINVTGANLSTAVAQKMAPGRKRAHAIGKLASPAGMMPFLRDPNDDPLPDNETTSLYEPNNLTGTPPGKTKQVPMKATSAVPITENGNRNFSFKLPVVSLPGRGLEVSLPLFYNSLLWHKSTNPSNGSTWMTYDVDSGYPGQGFRLGYGQIEDQGSAGFTLTESNGTRHALVSTGGSNYATTDGSFITFTGGSGWGTLYYPDGTRVLYGAAANGQRSYPTQITDRNGNYILIGYQNGVGPRITTIQDTLGRYIRFYYDSNNELVAITRPGLTGQSDIQVMRFYYNTLTLPSGLFGSGINVSKPATARVINYIYLPASGEGNTTGSGDVGYRFDYSQYGMVYQIKKFQGITVSTDSLSSTGTVTEGTNTTAVTTTYGYPVSAAALSDVPTFSYRDDEWAGRTNGGSAPRYQFATSETSTEKVLTVTAPDLTVSEIKSIKNAGAWNDGLITERSVKYSSVVYAKTVIDWEQNSANGTPRVASFRTTNEAGRTTAQVFTYDSATPYNNVFRISERDFTSDGSISGTELRKTETTYVTSTGYLNRRLLHLPSSVKVFPGGSSTSAYRIDYGYDDYGASNVNMTRRDDIIMHDPAFDPYQEWQEVWDWVCTEWGYNETGFFGCFNWEWQLVDLYTLYDMNTDYRGNITSVTSYPDANSTSNTITHANTYDIAGNVMTAQVDCCQSKSITYSTAYDDYAYPIEVTKGNPGGLHLTTNIEYDMNTGLLASVTDPNTQETSYFYNSDTLRLDYITSPDGGQTSYDYSNALAQDYAGRYHSNMVTTVKLDGTRYVDSKRYFDGRGALTQTFDNYTATDGWTVTDIEYDEMGRAYRSSNPYYCANGYGTCSINPSGVWTTSTFDRLGRVTQVTSPRGDDANPSLTNTIQTTYEGEVITVTDQAGKQRRQVRDGLGRLIRLDEPSTSGLGAVGTPNQRTDYVYDALDNLLKVTQGGQARYFKYDSLSRMIREKQVEQTPNSAYNLSDAVNTSGTWTRKVEYNSHGLITRSSDARGINTDYTYDGLNRLTLIDYSDSTPDARYFYDSQTLPSGAPSYTKGFSNGRLIAMTYGSSSSTTGTYFGYDNMGRVNVQKQVTGSNTYSLGYTYNLAGVLATQTYPTGRVLTYSYDNAGRPSQISDGTTTFASNFSYAPSGRLLSETWGNGAVHSIAYNNALQVSQIKLKQSSSGSELQRYDYLYGEVTQSNGSVDKSKNNGQIARIDGVINGAGTKEWDQRYSYDELGRLSTAAEYQQGTGSTPTWQQQFTYDRFGNRFQSGSANSVIPAYTTVVSSDIDANTNRFITSGSTPVTYDNAGNILQDAKFRMLNYTYDANNRQLSVAAMTSDLSQTSVYDCVGQRVQTTSNGLTRTMVYDVFGRVVADYNGTTVERENIYRDGELLAVSEAASTCYMTFNTFITLFYQGALNRNPTSTELANWTAKLTQGQAQGNGQLIKVAQSLGDAIFGSTEYISLGTGDPVFVTDLYEAFLQRAPDSGGYNWWIAAINGGSSRTAVRNGFAYSLEFQNNVVRLCPTTSSGTSTSANLKYVLNDAQGSTRALMDNSGSGTSTIVSRQDYLPFGEEIWSGIGLRTTTQKYGSTSKVRQRFALTERDEATGLDHTPFRKYDSFAGRWTTPDPLSGNVGNPQTLNRYAYVNNDPTNLNDPSGLLPCTFDEKGGWCITYAPDPIPRSDRERIFDEIGMNPGTTFNPGGGPRGGGPGGGGPGGGPGTGTGAPGGLGNLAGAVTAQQDPNCLTINKLLANSRVTGAFDAAWEATQKSGKENGGWLFSDENYPTDVFVYQAPEGTAGFMEGEPEAFRELLKTLPRSRPRRFILDYHTHKFNPSPGSDIWVRDTYLKRGSIGVTVHGKEYTFYNANKIIPPSQYNDCL